MNNKITNNKENDGITLNNNNANKWTNSPPMPPVSLAQLLGILSSGTAHATFLQHDPTFPTCPRGSRQHHNHHRRQHHSTPRGGHVLALQPTPRHHKKVCGVTFGECVRVCSSVWWQREHGGARPPTSLFHGTLAILKAGRWWKDGEVADTSNFQTRLDFPSLYLPPFSFPLSCSRLRLFEKMMEWEGCTYPFLEKKIIKWNKCPKKRCRHTDFFFYRKNDYSKNTR